MSTRVVSLPCWEAFLEQDESYREEVLGQGIPRIAVEAGATFGWERIVGSEAKLIGLDHFGASAPAGELAERFGLTPQAIAAAVLDHLARDQAELV